MRSKLVLGLFLLGAAGAPGAETDQKMDTVAGLIQKLEARDEQAQLTAVRQLGRLGVAAHEAVPALARLLHAPQANVRNQAAQALAQIGAPAVPALVGALQDRDQATRLRAARALAQIGPEAREAIPALIDALRDKAVDVRVGAVDALGEMGPEARAAAAPLARLLRDRSARVREHAVRTLAQIGPAAVGPLCGALADDEEETRLAAINALALFGPEAKEAVPALREALKGQSPQLRAAAAEALGRMKADAQYAVPELLAALRDKNRAVHDRAADALVLLTMAGVPGMLEQVRKAERRDRWLAAFVEAKQAARNRDPLTPLLQDLADKDPQVRIRAALTLGGLGLQARRALPALTKALTDDDEQVRLAVSMAIARVQRTEAEVDALLKLRLKAARDRLQDMASLRVGEAGALLTLRGKGVADRLQDLGPLAPSTSPALFSPAAQAQMYQLVTLAIAAAVTPGGGALSTAVDNSFTNIGPAAIPALVWGVNFIAAYTVGDC